MAETEQHIPKDFLENRIFTFKGIRYPTMLVKKSNLEAMENFQVRPDDIFLITYPKCGTHWAGEIIGLILNGGDPDKIDRTRYLAALEMSYPENHVDLSSPMKPWLEQVESWTSPRVMITHMPDNILPPQVFKEKTKVVYLTRNPKDCAVACYHTIQRDMAMFRQEWDKFIDEWINDSDNLLMAGFIVDHARAYWKYRHDSNFLFMKFEDMKRDPKGSIIKFANHLSRNLTDEELCRVVHYSTFKNMKETYDKIEKASPDGKYTVKAYGQSSFIRKGSSGNWKSYFTVAQNEAFDAKIREKLIGTGLVYDFE